MCICSNKLDEIVFNMQISPRFKKLHKNQLVNLIYRNAKNKFSAIFWPEGMAKSKTNSVACIRFDLDQWLSDGCRCCGAREFAPGMGHRTGTRSRRACGTLSGAGRKRTASLSQSSQYAKSHDGCRLPAPSV